MSYFGVSKYLNTTEPLTMPIQVTRMKEADIDGAIDTIQQAFANDPYNNWVFPDRKKVLNSVPVFLRALLTLPGLSSTKPRIPHPTMPLGHRTWPLPHRTRHVEPVQDPRLRHVAPPATHVRAGILVAIPLVLVSLGQPNSHEPVVRTWRPQHNTVLDMVGATGRGAV